MGDSTVWKDNKGVVRVQVGDQVDETFGIKIWDKDGVERVAMTWPDGEEPPPPNAPSITPSPKRGKFGDVFTLSGSGFAPAAQVTIAWNDPQGSTGMAPADASGGFSVTLGVPKYLKPGPYNMTADDRVHPKAETTFTVETADQPPPPPPPPPSPSGAPDFVLCIADAGAPGWGLSMLQSLAAAMQKYANEVCGAWGLPVNAVRAVATEAELPALCWPVRIGQSFPNAPQGAAGWHSEEQVPGDSSRWRAFANCLTFDNVQEVSAVVAHEMAEMIVEPFVTLDYQNGGPRWSQVDSMGRKWLTEACDPVVWQGMYQIDGWTACDFILPGWTGGAGPYDQAGQLSGPMSFTCGGYGQWVSADGRTSGAYTRTC